MGNIEKINKLSEAEKVVFDRLKKRGVLDKYEQKGYKIPGKEVWGFKSKKTHNINFYTDDKGKLLFFTFGLVRSFGYGDTREEKLNNGKKKVNKILKRMGYRWEKDEKTGIYYIKVLKPKKGEKIKIGQDKPNYYEIFETLGNIQYRDYLSDVIYEKGLKEEGEKLKKMPNLKEQMDEVIFPELEKMSNFYVLKPIELLLFKQYGIIEENHFKELKKKVYSFEYIEKLIENRVWDYVEGKDMEMKINGKIYKLNINQITENELKLYLDLKIISKEEYELLKDILEKRKLEQEKKEHIKKTKKHISTLKDDVIDNLG